MSPILPSATLIRSHRYTCSMAVDWHMSTLISPGIVKVVGASPPFVLMPEMGSVQSLQTLA